MNGPRVATLALSLAFVTSCGGMTHLVPTAPTSNAASVSLSPVSPLPTAPQPATPVFPISQVIQGVVGPLHSGTPPCFADRYACEVYDFRLSREGPIEVTLTWNGHERALMVQLYWDGTWLAHEDVAPRGGPPRISFRRPKMEATAYQLRVVSLEPAASVPFTLIVSTD